MTDLADLVRRAAQALGVWWDPRQPATVFWAARNRNTVVAARDGQLLVQLDVADDSTWEADAWTHVDAPTLALVLLGHARGMRVDIGECPACRGGREEVKTTGHIGEPGWTLRLSKTVAVEMWRPCLACTVDGEPTGRQTAAWERAVLDAMPKPASVHAYTEDHGELGREPREDWSPPEPGDPATRTALTVLAHRLADPVHVAWLGGTIAEHAPALIEALDQIIDAAACLRCNGSGSCECGLCDGTCETCNGSGRRGSLGA